MATTQKTTIIQKEAGMDPTPPDTTSKLEIEIALLRNNEQLHKYFDDSLEKYGKAISEKVSDQTKVFSDQVFALTQTVGTHSGKFDSIDTKLTTLKGDIRILKNRFAVVGSVCAAAGASAGFFISHLAK